MRAPGGFDRDELRAVAADPAVRAFVRELRPRIRPARSSAGAIFRSSRSFAGSTTSSRITDEIYEHITFDGHRPPVPSRASTGWPSAPSW